MRGIDTRSITPELFDEAQYEAAIPELRALATGADARVPSRFFGKLIVNLNASGFRITNRASRATFRS